MTLYVLSYIIFSQIYEDEFINFSDELIFFTYCHAFMKKTSLLFSFLICFLAVNAQDYFPVNGIKDINNAAVILTNATVHVDAQETLENCDVLIKEGKIVSVGSKLAFPKNTISYNLSGKHIYCSFIDVYSSFGIPKPKKATRPRSPQYNSSKKGPYYWNEAIKSEYNAVNEFSFNSKEQKELLKKGFGVVLTHKEDGVARGTGLLTTLHSKNKKSILSTSSSCFYSFKKGTSYQVYPSSLMGCIALLRQFNYDADWYGAEQKEFKDLSLESHLANSKKPQIFITDNALDIIRAAKIATEFNQQYIIKGGGDEYSRINEIKELGCSLIVPLKFPKAYNVEDPYDAAEISTAQLRHWKYAPKNLSILEAKNVPFAITSNGLSPANFLKNLRLAISKGLTKEAAYKALTQTPAALLKMENVLGKIAPGKWANLIVCSDELFEKNGVILENWTQGIQHVISTENPLDVRGNYNLNINQNIRTLVVKGDRKKPKASLEYNQVVDSISAGDLVLDNITGKPIKVTRKKKIPVNVKLENTKITISYILYGGSFTLSGIVNYASGSWDGNGQDPNGKWFKWTAIRNKKHSPKVDTNIGIKDTSASVNRFPSCSYGYDSLPKMQAYLIKNTTVWSSEEEGIIKNTDVLIANGKIKHVGQILDVVDPLTVVIDGTGKHLTAGLIDEHSHIGISRGVNEGSHSVTAEVRLKDVINPEDVNIYRQLAGGVTTAQLLHGSANPIGGQSALIKLRWGSSAEEMKFKTAPGFIKFALGENVKQSNWGDRNTIRFPQTRMGVEQVYYDAFTKAKQYEKNWGKYHSTKKKGKTVVEKPRRDLQLETLLEILNGKRFITCHSYVQSEINMLMKVADSMGFTLNTFTHILEGYKVADKMKAHGAGGSTFSDWWAYKYEVKDAIPHNAALLNAMGVTVAINSDDAEMGRRLNQEAAKGIKYGGMSEEDALKMVTINPAKLLHIDHKVGSIKEGKDADLVLWNNNPLSIYSKVEKTFIDGKLYFDYQKEEKRKLELAKERAAIITQMIDFKQKGGAVQKINSKANTVHNCSLIKDDGN